MHHSAKAVPSHTLTTDENHLLAMNSDHYTLQLVAMASESQLNNMVVDRHLQSHTSYYHAQLNGKNMYILTMGNYANKYLAADAISHLPSSLRDLHPIVRSVASVQQRIKAGQVNAGIA